ncbi:hypothetical protein IFR05_016223 [Cadophora sp. M221]|nr:hypothetical protein IFR05_016223 [Cadophora sp. M221]
MHHVASSYLTITLTIFTATTTVVASNPSPKLYIRSHQPPTADHHPSKRSPASSYNPLADFCGTGTSCSQACGSSFQTCPSNDAPATLHCFNPSSGQECCANGSGFACDPSFYCAQTPLGLTLCCPDSLSFSACADLNDTPTLETAHSTTTSTVFVPKSTTTPASTVTSTDVQTVIVTVETGGGGLASPTTTTTTVNATVTRMGTGVVTPSANESYVEYIPSSDGMSSTRALNWSMLCLMIGLGAGLRMF